MFCTKWFRRRRKSYRSNVGKSIGGNKHARLKDDSAKKMHLNTSSYGGEHSRGGGKLEAKESGFLSIIFTLAVGSIDGCGVAHRAQHYSSELTATFLRNTEQG